MRESLGVFLYYHFIDNNDNAKNAEKRRKIYMRRV